MIGSIDSIVTKFACISKASFSLRTADLSSRSNFHACKICSITSNSQFYDARDSCKWDSGCCSHSGPGISRDSKFVPEASPFLSRSKVFSTTSLGLTLRLQIFKNFSATESWKITRAFPIPRSLSVEFSLND